MPGEAWIALAIACLSVSAPLTAKILMRSRRGNGDSLYALELPQVCKQHADLLSEHTEQLAVLTTALNNHLVHNAEILQGFRDDMKDLRDDIKHIHELIN